MAGRGLVHIYCGDGKGKTTAAVGLAARARGAGLAVVFASFMKGRDSGELASLEKLGVDIVRHSCPGKFLANMDAAERDAFTEAQNRTLADAIARAGSCDLLVMDEIAGAVGAGVIAARVVTEFLSARRDSLEVVFTGRNPPAEWLELADYISEIQAIRHPFAAGTPARRGIEF